MMEKRLIDANALLNQADYRQCRECGDEDNIKVVTENDIYSAPTIDAVPVVRCRDCKNWSGRKDKPGEVTAIGYCDHPNHRIMPLNANWFCADGAKMDGGDCGC